MWSVGMLDIAVKISFAEGGIKKKRYLLMVSKIMFTKKNKRKKKRKQRKKRKGVDPR